MTSLRSEPRERLLRVSAGGRRRRARLLLGAAAALLCASAARDAGARTARERAVEQIPELMGRILESQEEIRAYEQEMTPALRRYTTRLAEARESVQRAGSESEAAEALVDYVETYAARLAVQEQGLREIESSIVRMYADSRELLRAAENAQRDAPEPPAQEPIVEDQYQGIAAAVGDLAERLGREQELETTSAVLHTSWSSRSALPDAIPALGRDHVVAFARRVEGLVAQHRARKNQLRAERVAVRRLLDMLIERQLGRRLDALFAGGDTGIASLLAAEGTSEEWSDLDSVVRRVLGLPSADGRESFRTAASRERLEFFRRGEHRE